MAVLAIFAQSSFQFTDLGFGLVQLLLVPSLHLVQLLLVPSLHLVQLLLIAGPFLLPLRLTWSLRCFLLSSQFLRLHGLILPRRLPSLP